MPDVTDIFITHGNPRFYSYLIEGIDAVEEKLKIPVADYSAITYDSRYFTQGDRFLILRSPTDREIVKYDSTSSFFGEYLIVTRGQGGTIAQPWPLGTRLFCATTADFYNRLFQPASYRTISYNPNEILTPLFVSEKIYQDSPAGCERWWKSFNDVDPYWDIITGAACGNEGYFDIGWTYDLLILEPWDVYFDNTKFTPVGPFGTWSTDRWNPFFFSTTYRLQISPIGGWNIGYRPIKFRITTTPTTLNNVYLAVKRGGAFYDVLLDGTGTLNSPHTFDLLSLAQDPTEVYMTCATNYSVLNLEWQE